MQDRSQETVTGWQAAAEMAGCSAATIRRAVKAGRVQADKVDGVYEICVADLLELRADRERYRTDDATQADSGSPREDQGSPEADERSDGELAAAVFALFREGADPVDAVVQLKARPEVVRSLHGQFVEMNGDRLIAAADWNRIEQLLGVEVDPARLPVFIRALAASHKKLQNLKYACSACGGDVQFSAEDLRELVSSGALKGFGHDGCISESHTQTLASEILAP